MSACVHMRITYCGEATYQSKVSSSNTLNPTDSWLCFVYILYCVYKYIHLYVHIWRAEVASLVARHRKEV